MEVLGPVYIDNRLRKGVHIIGLFTLTSKIQTSRESHPYSLKIGFKYVLI